MRSLVHPIAIALAAVSAAADSRAEASPGDDAVADAESHDELSPPEVPGLELDSHERSARDSASLYGIGVTAGARAIRFADGSLRGATDQNLGWQAGLTVGTRTAFAVELGYLGGRQRIEGPMGEFDGTSHGVDTRIRFNAIAAWYVQPFLTAGIGWRYFVEHDAAASADRRRDHVMTVPLGAGLALRARNLLLEVEGGYQYTFFHQLPGRLIDDAGSSGLSSWQLGASVGIEL